MSRQSSLRWRLGAVGLLLAVLIGTALVWQAVEAGGPKFAPQVLAAYQDKDLLVSVKLAGPAEKGLTGKASVELVDAAGKSLGTSESKLSKFDPNIDLAFKFAGVDKTKVDRLRVKFKGKQADIPLSEVLLGKGHETTVSTGTDFHAGSTASILCTVQGIRSIIDTVPHVGSNVTINLIDSKKNRTHLYSGLTDKDGKALANFDVPAIEAGTYTLEIVTKSTLGTEKLEHQVKIRADGKILLVTDKPIYQPGQLIHIRALALRSFDMKPIESKDIAFEVEDSKGNKVFKKSFKTSDFGIASVDFQLADEVNMGDYHLRAIIDNVRAEKTVQVKRYVLPKFKVEVKADKAFYLPKETVKVDLQSDYFFGKPVANSKIEVSASTFDIQFREFTKWKGETDANGHAKFEIKLPDYFVGQPVQSGNAIVKLEVTVLDNADHKEKVTKSYAVSDQAIQASVIPEGGRLAPNMLNRLFVAAIYPDGSPAANVEVKVWHQRQGDAGQPWRGGRFGPRGGMPVPDLPIRPQPKDQQQGQGEPFVVLKTNSAGLAEFQMIPREDQFRVGGWGQRNVEMVGGNQQPWGPHHVYDLLIEARDPRGNTARNVHSLSTNRFGENVLLRLDKAIYQSGDRVNIDVRTSAGLPTVYVDIVRGGQIMLSKWLDVKQGAATQSLDLPQNVFGSLEIHAYQMLAHGEIIRDSRVVYVQPRNDLKITVTPGKDVHEPGEDGRIRFQVTDQAGKPVPSALGVIVVDEAVYALQDLQPGLEKVYFTLQEELLKPQVQIKFSPGERLDQIIRLPVVPAPRQQVAEVLLTSVKLPAPQRWEVNPAAARKRDIEGRAGHMARVLFDYTWEKNDSIQFDADAEKWVFRKGLLEEMVKNNRLPGNWLDNGFGGKLTFADLARIEKEFTPESLGYAITAQRLLQWHHQVNNFAQLNAKDFLKDGRWLLPTDTLEKAMKVGGIDQRWLKDGFGQPFRLVKKEWKEKIENPNVFAYYDVVSTGPSRKLGAKDNMNIAAAQARNRHWEGDHWWWPHERLAKANDQFDRAEMLFEARRDLKGGMVPPPPMAAGGPGGAPRPEKSEGGRDPGQGGGGAQGGGAAPVTRVREYFPETMLWQPALITDDKGIADLSVSFADSITTWRLSASANSRGGAIGGATVPLKVFQDFFVDIDLPVSLTQADEIAFPVAVYNYLKTPQTVKIELQKEGWFELLEGGFERSLDLKPNEVTNVKFRIRAGKIGWQPLTVKAFGSKKSDAVKRVVEVVPNGQKFERVISDRLSGKVVQEVGMPGNAIPDASKLMVRIYPGVMAQVLEGVEGLIRLPGG
jgi:hypothetical protein